MDTEYIDYTKLGAKVCGNCGHAVSDEEDLELLRCHRYPPVNITSEEVPKDSSFPLIPAHEFCYEWAPKDANAQVKADDLTALLQRKNLQYKILTALAVAILITYFFLGYCHVM